MLASLQHCNYCPTQTYSKGFIMRVYLYMQFEFFTYILPVANEEFARHWCKYTLRSNLVGIFDIFIRNVCKICSSKVCPGHNDKANNVVGKVCKPNSRELLQDCTHLQTRSLLPLDEASMDSVVAASSCCSKEEHCSKHFSQECSLVEVVRWCCTWCESKVWGSHVCQSRADKLIAKRQGEVVNVFKTTFCKFLKVCCRVH